MSTDYPAALTHDPLAPILDDVWLVRGSVRMGLGMRINRNMVVVRDGGELTLLGPVRLSEEGQAELDALGPVKHVVRIGFFHTMDDRYYVDHYGAELWCQEGAKRVPGLEATQTLKVDGRFPIRDAELFVFEATKKPECAVLVKRGTGLLVTCDSVQSHTDSRHFTIPARIVTKLMGFKGMVVGPPWKKFMTPDGASLEGDFNRLAELDFDQLVGGHGTHCESGAKAQLLAAIAKAF